MWKQDLHLGISFAAKRAGNFCDKSQIILYSFSSGNFPVFSPVPPSFGSRVFYYYSWPQCFQWPFFMKLKINATIFVLSVSLQLFLDSRVIRGKTRSYACLYVRVLVGQIFAQRYAKPAAIASSFPPRLKQQIWQLF